MSSALLVSIGWLAFVMWNHGDSIRQIDEDLTISKQDKNDMKAGSLIFNSILGLVGVGLTLLFFGK